MASLASTVPQLQTGVSEWLLLVGFADFGIGILVQGFSIERGKEARGLAVDLGLAGVMSVDINGREYLMTQARQRASRTVM